MSKKFIISGLLILVMGFLGSHGRVEARINELKFAYPAHSKSELSKLLNYIIIPWTKQVKRASGGELVIKMYTGSALGTFQNIYDRTIKGDADISFGFHATEKKQFEKSLITALPGTTSTLQDSLAFWRLYEKGLISDEYRYVKPLAMWHFPAFGIQARERITKLSELKGKKLYVPKPSKQYFARVLGATPVTLQPAEVYKALERGIVEGFVAPKSFAVAHGYVSIAKYHLEVPLPATPAFVIMNRQRYAGLSPKARKAIDKLSGEEFVKRISIYLDDLLQSYETALKKIMVKTSTLEPSDWASVSKVGLYYAKEEADKVENGQKILSEYFAEKQKAGASIK